MLNTAETRFAKMFVDYVGRRVDLTSVGATEQDVKDLRADYSAKPSYVVCDIQPRGKEEIPSNVRETWQPAGSERVLRIVEPNRAESESGMVELVLSETTISTLEFESSNRQRILRVEHVGDFGEFRYLLRDIDGTYPWTIPEESIAILVTFSRENWRVVW